MITRQAVRAGNDRCPAAATVARPGRDLVPALRPCPEQSGAPGVEAFEHAPSPVHVLTEEGMIVQANAAFEELFGASRRQFVGRHQAVLNNASVAANLRLWEQIHSEACSRGYWRGMLRNRHSDGREFATLAYVCPMRAAGRRYLVCFEEELSDARSASIQKRRLMARQVHRARRTLDTLSDRPSELQRFAPAPSASTARELSLA